MVILSHDLQGTDGASLRAAGYSYQFWTAAAPSAMSFREIGVLETRDGRLTRAYGGSASDLNGDGWLDLCLVNEVSADVRVFLNRADGTGLYEPLLEPAFPVGEGASPNEPSDFNHDGNVDLCVANTGEDSVSVLLGNGDGTFGPQQEIIVGGTPRGIAVLDADGDGDVDIVSTSDTASHLALLVNDGAGVFGEPVFFEAGGTRSEWALAASDMNDDGILDLVIGNRRGGGVSGEIVINLGNGDGTFTALPEAYLTIGRVWMLVTGDVNGDGSEDVALASINNGNAAVQGAAILLGNGDGTLQPAVEYPISALDPTSTDLGDLDGDGDLDWSVGASTFPGKWSVFENDGEGVFTLVEEIPAPSSASCTLMLDFDNDRDLDLALVDEIRDLVILMESFDPDDCNENGTSDGEDIAIGSSLDCNVDGQPDECELRGNDCNSDSVPDDCQLTDNDCNENGVPDDCDLASEESTDTNASGVPDECEIPTFLRADCDGDGGASVNVTDAVFLLGFNFLGTGAPPCLAACDANGDGEVLGPDHRRALHPELPLQRRTAPEASVP